MASDEVTKLLEELEQSWADLGLSQFDHVKDYMGYYGLYYEQLPRPETSYAVMMIMNCHFLAADKIVQDDKSLDEVDAKYLGMFSRYYSPVEMEYYRRFYYRWVDSIHEEKILKKHWSSIPAVRQFVWMEWRGMNIAVGGLVKQILMLNYPNVDLDAALVSSAIAYTEIQSGLINDVGSIIMDKDSVEINYYIDVLPGKSGDQTKMLDASIKYFETLDLPSEIKLVFKSVLFGGYLTYRFSNRYFGRSEPTW